MTTTDSQKELLTEVDSQNNVVGPIKRDIAHKSKDKYYRTIFVIVKNAEGKILLQKRSATKDLYPNCWDLSVGGHVAYGDSYETTAIRELEEEVGIKANENELKYIGEVLVNLPKSHEYFHVYEYQLKAADKLKLAADEVDSINWLTINEIKKSMIDHREKWYGRPMQTIKALY